MPLAVDLFCGKGGWTIGLQAAGWRVIGFDIDAELTRDYPGELVLQDVATIDGTRMRGKVDLIVASPPCQAYSYRAMPWKRAKALPPPDNTLFEQPFRIAREAGCPVVVENVCGAQKWVGRSRFVYGSFHLWGDIPALMARPSNWRKCASPNIDWSKWKPGQKAQSFNWENEKAYRRLRDSVKFGGGWWHDTTNNLIRKASSRSNARREASALIAMIPFDLAKWIGEVYLPVKETSACTRQPTTTTP